MGIDDIFTDEYLNNCLNKYSHNFTKLRYVISFSELFEQVVEKYIITRMLGLLKTEIELYFEYVKRSKVMLKLDYENKSILVMELREDMYEFNFVFPYEKYDNMIEVVYDLNNLVSSDGMIVVYADNTPWRLKSGILIRTTKNTELIKEIASMNGMENDTSYGLEEYIKGIFGKQHNSFSLPPRATLEDIRRYFSTIFKHASEADLTNQNYDFQNYRKSKVFVSYSHKDSDVVYETIKKLEDKGLNFWVDYKEIDYGDSITEKVDSGIRECDIPIIFLSENTKTSLFAKHELKTFLRKIIYAQNNSKPWLIIKLDSVDLEDLFVGLSDYKYFNNQVQTIEELVQIVRNKIAK
ncbi:toll/interleukin-1 receptor domain-containing protein [Pseudolactococcus piscium]|nr:toll/interleukin-1 receptor domain-containing protein [Lactococcus piscium]